MTGSDIAGKETGGAPGPLPGAALLLLVLTWSWLLPWQATAGGVPFLAPPHLGLHLGGLLAAAALLREAPVPASLAGALFLASLVWDAAAHAAAGPPTPFLSPPHALAALATAVLLLHHGARAAAPGGAVRSALERGAVLLGLSLLAVEYLGPPNLWRAPGFHLAAATLFPVWLVAWRRGGGARSAATAASLAYLVLWAVGVGSLALAAPLLPAGPEGRLVVPSLPLALVLPALAVDLLAGERDGEAGGSAGRDALRALVLGPLFLLLLLGAHWYAAGVLVGTGEALPGSGGAAPGASADGGFWGLAPGRREWAAGMAAAGLAAAASSAAGFLLARVRRSREVDVRLRKAGRAATRATT